MEAVAGNKVTVLKEMNGLEGEGMGVGFRQRNWILVQFYSE